MFTGMIGTVGIFKKYESLSYGKKLTILAPALKEMLSLGDSIAVNGVCQTITHLSNSDACFDVLAAPVTLEKTNLGKLKLQEPVNLELALRLQDRLGGHLVTGHVNMMVQILSIVPKGEVTLLSLILPENIRPYVVAEGSLTLDGVSLTVATIKGLVATLSIIPHTLLNTTLQYKKEGDFMNIEVDIIAKYVESLLAQRRPVSSESRLWSLLQD